MKNKKNSERKQDRDRKLRETESQSHKGSEREGRKKEGRRKKARVEEREGGRVREREKEKEKKERKNCQGEKALTMELQGFVCLRQENQVVNGENFFTGGKLLVDSENYIVLIKH